MEKEGIFTNVNDLRQLLKELSPNSVVKVNIEKEEDSDSKTEREASENEVMNSPNGAIELMRNLLKEMDREYACVVNFDAQLRPINYNIAAVGGLSEVYHRISDIFKSTILSNAYGIMFFHNHPSGKADPSDADKKVREKIMNAAKTLDISVLDHIIIGEKKIYSFRTRKSYQIAD